MAARRPHLGAHRRVRLVPAGANPRRPAPRLARPRHRDARRRRASRSCSARRPRRRRAGCSTATPTCWPGTARAARAASARAGTTTSATRATARSAPASPASSPQRYGAQPARRRLADRQRIRLPRHHALLQPGRGGAPSAPGSPRSTATCAALNHAWGNVFWSMEYDSLRPDRPAEPDRHRGEPGALARLPPLLLRPGRRVQPRADRDHPRALRRAHPAQLHGQDRRVRPFRRRRRPRRRLLGQLPARLPRGPRRPRTTAWKAAFLRQGDPDNQAFHHDLYRAVGRGRWWVMEQQPGPVNWAPYNPAPLPGMVRLWTWEAFAHGAEVGLLLPLAPGALRAGADARGPAHPRQPRRARASPRRRRSRANSATGPRSSRTRPPASGSSSTTPPPGPGRRSRRAATSTTSASCSRPTAACG